MANLSQLRRARQVAAQRGIKLRSLGSGNSHRLVFLFPSGKKIQVWYPWEGRANNLEEKDLEEVLEHIRNS